MEEVMDLINAHGFSTMSFEYQVIMLKIERQCDHFRPEAKVTISKAVEEFVRKICKHSLKEFNKLQMKFLSVCAESTFY
ncbi:hypothetical protein T265_02954 [Opisthorchis viverrini]|uniref:Transcription factor CBF/NF-Y/archaeal histone domain-containing protein n=1 Tax=Opisthorchis viverrini TaxID=6198 RepID=A0A074ZT59_OPIVI|nr:hypothetical protein T265_02954 [Opisthorchis viverrini]KER30598.1 hypothetical protein T265_02954 [Opisthorchis viverrini]